VIDVMATLPKICCVMWILQLLIATLLLGQHWLGVLHPMGEVLVVLLILTLLVLVWCISLFMRPLFQRQAGMNTFLFFAATMVPVLLLMSSFGYARQQWAIRQVPSGARGNIAIMCGASLMKVQAKYLYTNHVESDRLVMCYSDLTSPDADLQAMDRHVSELAKLLGRPLRNKIHWVPGPLLGQRNVSVMGLALGSEQSLDWGVEVGRV